MLQQALQQGPRRAHDLPRVELAKTGSETLDRIRERHALDVADRKRIEVERRALDERGAEVDGDESCLFAHASGQA
jgi:hypothetical protein